jgi:hypothetical protein
MHGVVVGQTVEARARLVVVDEPPGAVVGHALGDVTFDGVGGFGGVEEGPVPHAFHVVTVFVEGGGQEHFDVGYILVLAVINGVSDEAVVVEDFWLGPLERAESFVVAGVIG